MGMAVVMGMAYVIGAAMEYEGMLVEVVVSARGIKEGINGAASDSTAVGTGAGAEGLLEAFFFFFFLPPQSVGAMAPQEMTATTANQSQIGKLKPEEPEAVDPELLPEPDDALCMDSVIKDAEEPPMEAEESVIPDDESHGVCVGW